MPELRLAALAATIICGAMLVNGTGIASAPTGPARMTQVVPLTGTAKSGKKFTGSYTIDRFIARGGKLYSVGTVKGKLAGKRVRRENVRMPAQVANASGGAARASQVPPLPLPPLPPGNACSILALDLGPINLPVLGLVVRTNQIRLRIDAVQGPGNLSAISCAGSRGSSIPARWGARHSAILNALLALSPRTG